MIVYTEKATSLLYKVQLFEDFVLVRPASPGFESVTEKLSLTEFADRFDEFWGDRAQLRKLMGEEIETDEECEGGPEAIQSSPRSS